MLRSSNPILSKQDAFTPAAPQYGQTQYNRSPYQQYPPETYRPAPVQQAPEGRMSFDDVVTKTAVTMGVLAIAAGLAWMAVPDGLATSAAMVLSGLIGFVVVMVVSFRRVVSPALVLVYAAVEGVFIGMISKVFEYQFPGIVAQAVLATFVAAGVTLAAYKIFNIRVTPKFQKIVFISTIAFAGVMLVNFIVSVVTGTPGLRGGLTGPVQPIAYLFSAIAIVLAVLNLVLDFDYVEKGVAMGAPARESWRAAFGLTVTMVWLYIEMLRLLSYLRR